VVFTCFKYLQAKKPVSIRLKSLFIAVFIEKGRLSQNRANARFYALILLFSLIPLEIARMKVYFSRSWSFSGDERRILDQ
jgi:hypothetical protein